MSSSRPTVAELRAVAQPPAVLGRVSSEHWAGLLYMRRISIYLTRVLVPSPLTPDAVTWVMLLTGLGAALVLTVPYWWTPVLAMVLVQVQLLLDCSDGELARWRGRTGPTGIYIDRVAHYVTEAALAIAVGVHADGGLGAIGGWTTLGLASGVLVLMSKAETDLVFVARVVSGQPPPPEDAATKAPAVSVLRRLRRAAARFPFNRALLAVEGSALAAVVGVVEAATGTLRPMQVYAVVLLAIAAIVAVGHLLSIVTSGRLR